MIAVDYNGEVDTMTYGIMLNPRHGRVYMGMAGTMAANELAFAGRLLSQPPEDVRVEDIGGVPYILFSRADPLEAKDVRVLSRLSFFYALFEVRDGSGLLAPIARDHGYFIDEDISAILKYTGKTNELFTRLMLNLALAHVQSTTPVPGTAPVCVLDPMAGKGTTLYEALMQDCDAYGVEIDPKPAYEAFVYIKKHFEMARYKHISHTEKTGGVDSAGKKFSATRYQVEMARSKDEQKAGLSRRFEMIAGDTRHVGSYFKKNSFHAIVADLPYGVQHGAKKKPQGGGQSRNALGLVQESMPGWVRVLKPGGVVVLAWNLFLINWDEMAATFADNGLKVTEGLDFTHRLDQATNRDLMVGVL